REYECLRWAARGNSAWVTGRILGIKPRTIAFHLDNAKKKLARLMHDDPSERLADVA
ncbi:helix-turn-helix transcriptional regulator, partial [Mesorhizobium sp. M8A.F.Ca.ET.208.01.1.1]|uniref:helix-turn-helix domain-containing protein n=1 Tax=Mesorhizobium sp. M8A.F.Ca.ET.208.01.1.1 TaxID=2563969 RepID=UPI001093B3AF